MKTNKLIQLSLVLTLVIVSAQLSIPMPLGVPFSLQTLMFCLIGLLFTFNEIIIINFTYLLMGIIGLPVFANFNSGIHTILGPTGGFIIGFVILSLLVSFTKKMTGNKYSLTILIFFASLIHLLIGTIYFAWIMNYKFNDAILITFSPYIIFAFIKAYLACTIYLKLREIL